MAVNSFNAQNPPVTTKGDLFTFSTIPTRLGVGTNNQVLTADSAAATGLKWATPASWSPNLTLLNSGGTALTGAATITVNVSAYDVYFVRIENASSANASSIISFRMNADSGSNYSHVYLGHESYTAVSDGTQFAQSDYRLAVMGDTAARTVSAYFTVLGGKNAGIKTVNSVGFGSPNSSGVTNYSYVSNGFWNNSSAISSISVISSTGNFDAGTVFVYGG